ncbi:MAG: ATP-binding cassette domain-containing protein [Candidatus Nezhaarchaeales archaeon]
MRKGGNCVLEIANLWFKYPNGDWVLRGLDLSVSEGEHVLVIGETGSGKTTLTRIITGSANLIYDGILKGRVAINGISLEENTEAFTSQVALIGQNPYLYFTEPLVRHDLYSYALSVHGNVERAVKALNKAIEVTDIQDLIEKYFFELSGGQAKRVLVAKALISNSQLLLFDEPLMWLDDVGLKDFINLLNILKVLRRSVVIFEHRFMPLIEHVDEVYVLKNGKLTRISNRLHAFKEAGGKVHHSFDCGPNCKSSSNGGNVLLETVDVHFKYRNSSDYVLRGINLKLCKGDLVLLYGSNGQGKTTLLKVLAGYLKPSRGRVTRKTDVIYIPQNVVLFYTESTVEKEVVEICKARKMSDVHVKLGIEAVKKLGIDPMQSPFNLSHGQMVKLAFELARTSNSEILLLDEPFSGLTYGDRLELLRHLVESNCTAIVATSNLDAIGSPYWTKLYKIESGKLVVLNPISSPSLLYASRLYEEIIGVE